MDDSQLTRLAIEEIVREMHETKELELQVTQERKVNPLGKPNKRFLDRTLNSVLTHNKRENERTQASCRRKLKELDDRRRKRLRNEEYRRRRSSENDKRRKRRSRSESSHEKYSSTSSEDKSPARPKKSNHKKKKKNSKARSNSEDDKRVRQQVDENFAYAESYNDIEENSYLTSDNVTNLAYNLAVYNQMNQFLHYEAILQAGMEAVTKTNTERLALKCEKEIGSITVSTSNSSSSSLSSSSSSSSMEEDENGVLTIYLSSDEHSNSSNTNIDGKRKQIGCTASSVLHFDLNTSSSSRSSPILNSSARTYRKSSSSVAVLSCSSNTDTEVANKSLAELPAVVTCPSDANTQVPNTSASVPDTPEVMIDLTDD